MATIYVTGHRNPDTDSIASAIGYAELKSRLDSGNEYVPARLGDVNPQTAWALERSEAQAPEFLPHIQLRASDLMRRDFVSVCTIDPVREAGLAMARVDSDLVPVIDEDGILVGVVTTRALARRYIRESRQSSTLSEPTYVHAVVAVLEGELITGEDRQLRGRVWVHSMDASTRTGIADGDLVVAGDRADAQRAAIEAGAALIVTANAARPGREIVDLAKARDVTIVVSPLDAYVTARMISLAAPCKGLMESDLLTANPDDLVTDVADTIKDAHHGVCVVVDATNHPLGVITRSDLVSPQRRRVILVDHAEQGQSVPGIEHAEIVEILDHHHIGSIETRVPVLATFDPVGSTATLVVERFRRNGMEPSRPTAMMLLAAVLSDTVILNSPTTTERDHQVVHYLERVLALDATDFGRQMFEDNSDVSEVSAEELVRRDAKHYQSASGQQFCIAQVEVVGATIMDRKEELLEAMRRESAKHGLQVYALMVTNVLDKGTELLVVGEMGAVARAFGSEAANSDVIDLPGVMSRKKQVAPKLLAAL